MKILKWIGLGLLAIFLILPGGQSDERDGYLSVQRLLIAKEVGKKPSDLRSSQYRKRDQVQIVTENLAHIESAFSFHGHTDAPTYYQMIVRRNPDRDSYSAECFSIEGLDKPCF